MRPKGTLIIKDKQIIKVKNIGDWNVKGGSQEIPGVTGKFVLGSTKWSRAKANRALLEKALVMANTVFRQHKRWFYTWTSPDDQYPNQTDYVLCSRRWRSSIHSAKTRPGANCGSDQELLQALLQSHSHQDTTVLAQRQKYRSMEQNRKPRDKSMNLWTPYLRQRRQEYTIEKRQPL